MAERCRQADFHPDKQFFVDIRTQHAGNDGGDGSCRMRFHLPPVQMDQFAATCELNNPRLLRALEAAKAETRRPVRLQGLQGAAHLNGKEGRVNVHDNGGAWDKSKGRWTVRLNGGDTLSVKPANIEWLDGQPAPPAQ